MLFIVQVETATYLERFITNMQRERSEVLKISVFEWMV